MPSPAHDDHVPTRAWIAMAVSSSSVVLLLLDTGMISIAFPSITEHFADAPRTRLAWSASGFFLALSTLMLLAGRIADRRGRKRIFMLGLLGYAVGAAVCATAVNEWILISGRVVMGIGTAFLSPSALSLVLPLFPLSRRATALGVWGLVGSVAGIVAQPLGAVIVEITTWRAVFVTLTVVSLAIVVVAHFVLDEADVTPRSSGPLDPVSVVSGSLALTATALVLVEGPQWGWTSPGVVGLGLATVTLAVTFVRRSAVIDSPLVDIGLLAQRRFGTATVASFVTQVGFFGFYFAMPIWFREVSGYSVLQAGLALAPVNIVASALSVQAGRWVDRNGPRRMMAAGGVVCGVGYSCWIVLATPESRWLTTFLPVMIILGVGGLWIGNTCTSAALHGLPDGDLGSANAAYQVIRRFGSTVGVISVTSLIGDRTGADLADVFAWVWALSAVTYVAGGVVTWLAYPADTPRSRTLATAASRP